MVYTIYFQIICQMDVLNHLGWHLCSRRFPIHPRWSTDLVYRKDMSLFILETKRAAPAAHITADLMGKHLKTFQIYYGYLDIGDSIDGIRRWTPEDYIETILI